MLRKRFAIFNDGQGLAIIRGNSVRPLKGLQRSLGRRHTFCISLDFGQIDLFTSSCSWVSSS